MASEHDADGSISRIKNDHEDNINNNSSSNNEQKPRYVIATRGSRLSLAQTCAIAEQIKSAHPDVTLETSTMTTKGDTDARPLFAIDQKGIFEKEIDRAVAEYRADFAVHSLKDVPSALPDGLVLACVPRREISDDVLVTPDGSTLEQMRRGAVIGTSSLRRAVQITRQRPDITVKPIRGNIETRASKVVAGGPIDGIILAYAGITRLNLDVKYTMLPEEQFLPSPGQGALAIIARAEAEQIIRMLESVEHAESRAEAEAERALSEAVGSGCRFPVGARARCHNDKITITADAFSIDGRTRVAVSMSGPADDPTNLGRRAGQEMIAKGVDKLGLKWREGLAEWNKT